jgi:hypothetical protein
MGVHISNRVDEIPAVQKILTDHGCNIKTRLGLHDAGNPACSSKGLLILELVGDDSAILEMQSKLKAITGVEVQKMVFVE